MKFTIILVFSAVALALFLWGCSFTNEPVRHRDDFFPPVTVLPQRGQAMLPTAEIAELKNQLESAANVAKALRDSLSSFQQYTGSLLVSTRALVDKVSELEAKEFLSTNRQKNLEQSVAQLQTENKQLSGQLADLQSRVLAGKVGESSVFSQVRTSTNFHNEYAGALSLFKQRKYEGATDSFKELLEKGIDEDLADHCEYWIGECYFARRGYQQAVSQFQKVITSSSSNKKADAYYMMGRSYEALGDPGKAWWAYEELLTHCPMSEHVRAAHDKAESLKRITPAPRESKHHKTTT